MCIPFWCSRGRFRKGRIPRAGRFRKFPAEAFRPVHVRKEINASILSSVMKQARKKSGREEPEGQVPTGEMVIGGESRDNPGGVDAIHVLQLITGGVVLIILAWFVLHSVLKVI